jgi:hypothetical protein
MDRINIVARNRVVGLAVRTVETRVQIAAIFGLHG